MPIDETTLELIALTVLAGLATVVFFIAIYLADRQSDRLIRKITGDN